jgi:lysyl endopeptidase
LTRTFINFAIALGIALFCASGSPARDVSVVPPSAKHAAAELREVMIRELDVIFPHELLAEDAAKALYGPAPQRFALPTDVTITPNTDGTWEQLDDGGWLWRLRVDSPNATDLNFGFTRFRLPEGATLHLVSLDHDYFQGPYGAADNRDHGELWTPVIPGERAVIELYVPPEPEFEPELVLGSIGRGYRDWFGKLNANLKQGDCNIDVVCSEADGWRSQIQSVAAYSIRGSIVCTGNLILDVTRTHRPFFLTAYHCGISSANDQTVVTYWNYQSPVCGRLGGGTLNQSVSGATFLASRQDVDFCLVELDSAPPPEFNPFWTGWDRRMNHTPNGSVGIHHPGGDEKAISFNDDPLLVNSTCIYVASTPDTHWYVDDWEQGTTEAGSSGSGLWDRDSKLLVGYLSGGLASCSNPTGYDCFGRIAVAWDGPSPDQRLRDWLDPLDLGVQIVPGELPRLEFVLIGWPAIYYLPVYPQPVTGQR